MCWGELRGVCCCCVGVWQCHQQFYIRPSRQVCEEIYPVPHLPWIVSVSMFVPDLLQESGKLSSCVFSVIRIWTL